MYLSMQQPAAYPFYMNKPASFISTPWSSVPFNLSSLHHRQVPLPLNVPQQPRSPFLLHRRASSSRKSHVKNLPTSASFSNSRYNSLKQSASYTNRRPVIHSVDATTRSHRLSAQHYSPFVPQSYSEKAGSVSEFDRLSKTQSLHTMGSHRSSNLSVSYAKEVRLTPKRRRKHSPQKKPQIQPRRPLSSSPKRRLPLNIPQRRRPMNIPERGVVRISTLDEMPLPSSLSRTHSRTNSINNDRSSMKGSVSNSSQHRKKTKRTNSIRSRNRFDNSEGNDTQSSSSSNDSHLAFQRRINGSLRKDPLISAAMDEYQQHRRRSLSRTPSRISNQRNLSRDSLCSDSIFRSSSSSSSPSPSPSSFTSVERSEIRQIIKTIKTKPILSVQNPPIAPPHPIQSKIIPLSASSSEQSLATNPPLKPSTILNKPRKSSITEELDREFSKLRALDPDQDISYVTPSSICKRKTKTLEKPPDNKSPMPTFDELLRKVQLRPIDNSVKPIVPSKEKVQEENYENPFLSVPVPRSSPIPTPIEEVEIEIPKPEYAIPIKKSEIKSIPQVSQFQPSRRFRFTKPFSTVAPERRTSRSLSMLNWFQQNRTDQFLTTFQPNPMTTTTTKQSEYESTTGSVKENIYTSDVDIYASTSNNDKLQDQSLQMHLENQTILTDHYFSEYESKQTMTTSSIINDFSQLLKRKHKHQKKDQRCSIM